MNEIIDGALVGLHAIMIARYDKLGIRIHTTMAADGKYGLDIYHKNLQPKDDADWKMIRVPHLESYPSRKEAIDSGIKIAREIYEKLINE